MDASEVSASLRLVRPRGTIDFLFQLFSNEFTYRRVDVDEYAHYRFGRNIQICTWKNCAIHFTLVSMFDVI